MHNLYSRQYESSPELKKPSVNSRSQSDLLQMRQVPESQSEIYDFDYSMLSENRSGRYHHSVMRSQVDFKSEYLQQLRERKE
jgi:hypothetical protein